MKKIKNYIIGGLLSVALFTSCEDTVTAPNLQNDPNTFGDAPAASVLGQAELELILFHGSDAARYAGILTNQITGVAAQWANYNRYDLTFGDFDGIWDNLYQDGIAQAQFAKAKAIASGNKDLEATAQLLEAIFIGELAGFFGDVPYTEANNPNILNPKFDSQRSVLEAAINLLNSAISNATSNAFLNDGVGGTSTTSSISQIANSLKARYYMILKDYPNALISARNGIQSRSGDLVANFGTSTGQENLFFQFGVDQRAGNIGSGGSYLFNLLSTSAPNRRLATPGDTQRSQYYFNGVDFNYTASGIFGETTSMPLVSWYETKLIEAEAAARTSQDGLTPLNAVRTELASQYSASFPASTATGNDLLTDILEEKYITLFPSPVVFHDLQRTNNSINVATKIGTSFPKRFIYPESETLSNSNAPAVKPDLFTATPVNQ